MIQVDYVNGLKPPLSSPYFFGKSRLMNVDFSMNNKSQAKVLNFNARCKVHASMRQWFCWLSNFRGLNPKDTSKKKIKLPKTSNKSHRATNHALCFAGFSVKTAHLDIEKTEPFFSLPEKLVQDFISWNCDVARFPRWSNSFKQNLSNSGFELVRCQKIPIRNICEGSYSILCSSPAVKQRPAAWGFGEMYTAMKVYMFFLFHEFCLAKEIDPHSIYPYAELLFYICTSDEYLMNKCFFTDVARSNGIMQS